MTIRRRDFITLLGGTAAGWPLAARAQQAVPVIAFVSGGSADVSVDRVRAFRQGLVESGRAEGQNVSIEYHWLNGEYGHLDSLMGDFAKRRVAIIATPDSQPAALAAKAATAAIPIVFGTADDPVKLGLVASLARPGGNATGINFLSTEVLAKRLGLLHELLPKARRIALMVNHANLSTTEQAMREIPEAAVKLGLATSVLKASTSAEIEEAFATLGRNPADGLFVSNDTFFSSRRVQFAILAARYGIPSSYSNSTYVESGGLMSYGSDILDRYRQAGVYAGRILKGEKPADLPIVQSSKFELAINMPAARALGLSVPPDFLSISDRVIE